MTRGRARWGGIFLVALAALAAPSPAASAPVGLPTAPVEAWAPNGEIAAFARHGNRIYVGGSFTRFGPRVRGGASLDTSQGSYDATFPSFDGDVTASVPDGQGGWFVGGTFARVADQPRAGLAHVHADGTLDPAWTPELPENREVYGLALVGDRVVVGGVFATIAGAQRKNLAAVDRTTGAFDPTWGADASSTVTGLHSSQGRLFAVGGFWEIGGVARDGVAELDPETGGVEDWSVGTVLGAGVRGLTLDGGRVYLVGSFERVGDVRADNLVAVRADTGAVDSSWRPPGPSDSLAAVAVVGRRVIVGGSFGLVGTTRRLGLAAYDVDSAALDPDWAADTSGVTQLVVHQGRLFVAGRFFGIGGQDRSRLAEIDPRTGAILDGWRPEADGPVLTLTASGGRLFAGGSFSSVNGVARTGLAALDAGTGALISDWNPSLREPSPGDLGNVTSLAVSRGRLYVAHRFGVAALSLPSGDRVASFRPVVDSVYAMAADGTRLYLGGSFSTLNGANRRYFGAVDLETGQSAPGWESSLGTQEFVDDLAISPGQVHLVGNLLNSTRVAYDGSPLMSRGASESIAAVALSPDHVYVGGRFGGMASSTSRYDTRFKYLVRFDRLTGALDESWRPGLDAAVDNLSVSGPHLVVTGRFSTFAGQARSRLAVLDTSTGAVDPWQPAFRGSGPSDLAGRVAVLAGPSQISPGQSTGALSVFCCREGVTDLPRPAVQPTVSGAHDPGATLTCSPGAWDNQPDAYRYRWLTGATQLGTGPSYTITPGDAGSRIACEVVAGNAAGEVAAESTRQLVSPSPPPPPPPPANVTPPAITGEAAVGATLTCEPGDWSGASAYTYAWSRAGTAVATGSSYAVTGTDAGQPLTCEVTATGQGGSSSASSSPVQVPAAPQNTVAPTIAGTPQPGQTLTCVAGTWTGEQLARSYSWHGEGISGHNSQTLELTAADVGRAITCREQVSGRGGVTSADSAPVTVVGQPPTGTAPTNVEPPSITGRAEPGEALACASGLWADDPDRFEYTWSRDGEAAGDEATYLVREGDRGSTLQCTESAVNEHGTTSAASATVSVPSTPPGPSGPGTQPGPSGETVSNPSGLVLPGSLQRPWTAPVTPAAPRLTQLRAGPAGSRRQAFTLRFRLSRATPVRLTLRRCVSARRPRCRTSRRVKGTLVKRAGAGRNAVHVPSAWAGRRLVAGTYRVELHAVHRGRPIRLGRTDVRVGRR